MMGMKVFRVVIGALSLVLAAGEAAVELPTWIGVDSSTPCGGALAAAAHPAALSRHGDLKQGVEAQYRATLDAVQACEAFPEAKAFALALQGSAAQALGGKEREAANATLAAVREAGVAQTAVLGNVSSASQRLQAMERLVWEGRTLAALGEQLQAVGGWDAAAPALALAQSKVLQRWRLQASLHAARKASRAREVSVESQDVALSTGKPWQAADDGSGGSVGGPRRLAQTVADMGPRATWPDAAQGEGRAVRRRSLVTNITAHMANLADTAAEWDAEGGLVAADPLYFLTWGEPYGPFLPQFVPEASASAHTWTGRVAGAASFGTPAAEDASPLAPALGTYAQLPASYQFGPNAGCVTGRFWEGEMHFLEFEDVFVEGAAGIVYDDKTVFAVDAGAVSHMARHFHGDAGTGGMAPPAKQVVRVPVGLSLVQPGQDTYTAWVTQVLPRFMLVTEQLKNRASGAGHASMADLPDMRILLRAGAPYVGAFADMLRIGVGHMVLVHPHHTVVHADKLFVGTWGPPPHRAPRGLGAFPESTMADAEVMATAETVLSAADSLTLPPPFNASESIASRRALAAVWESRLQGKLPLSQVGLRGRSATETQGEVKPSLLAAGVEVWGEQASEDVRVPPPVAPRALLQLVRRHFAGLLVPKPQPEHALDTTQEVRKAAEVETGEKRVKSRRRRKWKKRSRAERAKAGSADQENGEWEEPPPAWQSFSGFSSPFLWDNGTVLAYPPIRNVVVVTSDVDTGRALAKPQAVMRCLKAFFQEAVEETHHGGMRGQRTGSPAVVMSVGASDSDTLAQMTHPMIGQRWQADDMHLAAETGLLHLRAWLRTEQEEAAQGALAKRRAAAVHASKAAHEGGTLLTPRVDGSQFNGSFGAVPVVDARMTIVEVDVAAAPLAAVLRMFQLADVVVGVGGGGLANTVFSPPTTSVLEFASPAGNQRSMQAVAAGGSLDYWMQVAGDTGAAQQQQHVRVKLKHLRATLAALIARRKAVNERAQQAALHARSELWHRGLLKPKGKHKAAAGKAAS